jgi:phage terminase large subunit-like protein
MVRGRINKAAADRAVGFIESLKLTQGRFAGQPFKLMPWQRKIIRDVFGTMRPDGTRQYRQVWIEIPKKNGKSPLGSAIALKLLAADDEMSPEIYSAASDREQAAIVYNVARDMVSMSPALSAPNRCKTIDSVRRIVNYANRGFYRVLSAEYRTKHGFNIHGLIFDEVHTLPNRDLFDVLTSYSGAAREQPLFVYLTTAGIDRNSICWEEHQKAEQIFKGLRNDPEYYVVIYSLDEEEDWGDEKNWYRVNPSLGKTIKLEDMRHDYRDAVQDPAEENLFRQLRLNQWVKSTIRAISLKAWDACKGKIDEKELEGHVCYAGLDLSSSIDLTALNLVFPDGEDEFKTIARFWIPEDTMREKERKDKVPYSKWVKKGWIKATPGNVIDYGFIRQELNQLREKYEIKELAFDRWGAALLLQQLQDDGFVIEEKEAGLGHPLIVPFGQGYASMSPPTKELIKIVLDSKRKRLNHDGNPVLRWNIDNLVVIQDAAENLKPDKAKATQRIDGVVALIMALDRAIKHQDEGPSVYESEDIKVL